ncbi:predicted protein [Histoplasma capsulatum G186AR]|uniref:Uncharacterized protein n=2 Tax=Ajellomyces capsulatus TaxID=5037 RepID=C0NQ06_AJECG|nr:uncharacterized protein HCBG_05236 [Histoplasma capsulatum G186AR]EEH07016.1 predicted protein [Histoplasma capsulatum G186AR]KAG5293959.1 hypothetical protein I7I52_05447 [Histoplasma capsulatum]QSS75411.1 hypothetical protein I7I50_04538 [Histoplasma capsulatum G186AR]
MPHFPSNASYATSRLPYPVRSLHEDFLAVYIPFEASDRNGSFGIWFSFSSDPVVLQRHNTANTQDQFQSHARGKGGFLHFVEHGNGHYSKHERDIDGDVKMADIFDRRDSTSETIERALDEILNSRK